MGVELFKEEKITEREKETVAGPWVEYSVLRRECSVLSFWLLHYFYTWIRFFLLKFPVLLIAVKLVTFRF
jgi:hypothetical protein